MLTHTVLIVLRGCIFRRIFAEMSPNDWGRQPFPVKEPILPVFHRNIAGSRNLFWDMKSVLTPERSK